MVPMVHHCGHSRMMGPDNYRDVTEELGLKLSLAAIATQLGDADGMYWESI